MPRFHNPMRKNLTMDHYRNIFSNGSFHPLLEGYRLFLHPLDCEKTSKGTSPWKYKKEGIDEMAEQNLKRCDSLCLKLFIVVMIAVAWGCAIFNHAESADMGLVGWIIVLSILVLSVVRTIMFAIMDSRGV